MKTKKMKSAILLLTACVMVIFTATMAYAEVTSVDRYGRGELAKMADSDKLLWAYDKITMGVDNFDEIIYLKNDEHSLTIDEADLVIKLHDRDYPEHSYMDGKKGEYSLDESETFVESFAPLYTQTEDEVSESVLNGVVSYYMTINDIVFNRKINAVTSVLDDLKFTKNFGKNRANYEITDEEIVSTMLNKICPPRTDKQNNSISMYNNELSIIGLAKNRQYTLNLYGIEAFLIEPETEKGKVYVAAKIDGKYLYIDMNNVKSDFKYRISASDDKNVEHLVPLPNMDGVMDQVEKNTQYIKIAVIGLCTVIFISIVFLSVKKKAPMEQ